MKRRDFIAGLAGVAAWPFEGRAQEPGRVQLAGVLMGQAESDPEEHLIFTTFWQELEKLGWTVNRNLQIEVRWAAGDAERARAGAAELLRLAPDVLLVAYSGPALAVLQRATRTIPIIFVSISEPVARGFVASLARPGGNITGFSSVEPTLGAKWLQLLKGIAPDIRRVVLVFNTETIPFNVAFLRSAEAAAMKFNVDVDQAPVRESAEIEAVMTRLTHDPGGGLIFPPDGFIRTHRQSIVEMAAHYRLPAVYSNRVYPEAGGLLSYSADGIDMFRRSATYVDRILRGDKPAELPVQQPTRYEFVLNLKTAKLLGITVPPSLLALADEVIE